MQFDLSEEQQELTAFIRELFEQRSGSTQVRSIMESDTPYDTELWSILCEQIGAAALAIPEEYGGAGFSTRETHIVLEELGRALTPSPFLGSVAIAAQAVLASGNTAACERILPHVAAGESIAALAWADAQGVWNPAQTALTATEQGVLSGEIPMVLEGSHADVLLAIAQTPDGPALFEIDDIEQVTRTATATLDQTLNLATLSFNEVPATLLAAPGTQNTNLMFERIRNHALTAVTATQVGTAAQCLDMTVAYSKQRSQFGRTIGSFQALKHRMADMHVMLETARTTSYAAAWAESTLDAGWSELAMIAKTVSSDALNHIAGEAIQLHGGIAITWEHDAHLIFKRASATSQLFGTAATQRAALAGSLGL